MKISVIISLGLNGVLLALYFLKSEPHPLPSFPPIAESPKPNISQPESVSFSWRQVESKDYAVYIANLRKLGCPERTIRNIITDAVACQYEDKIREAQGTEAQQKLQQEQVKSVESYLGMQSHPDPAGRQSVTPMTAMESAGSASSNSVQESLSGSPYYQQEPPAKETPVSVPLAFIAPSPAVDLNAPQQQEALTQLQQGFVDAVGGQSQNPADPAYTAKWKSAQPSSDDRFRLWFGDQAYMAQQAQAYLKASKQ